jgi:iron(III) transport system substrate-binding protein
VNGAGGNQSEGVEKMEGMDFSEGRQPRMVQPRWMLGLSLAVALLALAGAPPRSAHGQAGENWDHLLAAAKKEGRMIIYGVSSFRPMVETMRAEVAKRYNIKLEFLVGRSREVRERVMGEFRTKRHVADTAMAGATSLPALWEDGAAENWLPPSLKVVRPEILKGLAGIPITPLYAQIQGGVLINTNWVSPEDAPKSWRDLTDPKWHGKILMDDPRAAGAGYTVFVSLLRHPNLGKEFHVKLAQNRPIFLGTGTYQQIANMVAQGQYPIGFPVDSDAILELKGAPVRWIALKEGVSYTVMGIALVKNAPRPNAAKVFIEFALSEAFQRVVAETSAPVRIGVKAKREEWSLDHVNLLPRPLADSRKERDEMYRLAESIYGVR